MIKKGYYINPARIRAEAERQSQEKQKIFDSYNFLSKVVSNPEILSANHQDVQTAKEFLKKYHGKDNRAYITFAIDAIEKYII